MSNFITVLEITSWIGYSFGAEHYYGVLKGDIDDKLVSVQIEKVLTEQEAKKLSKTDDFPYKEGGKTSRFDNKEEIIKIALEIWKDRFPQARVLMQGRYATADPQQTLDGDPSRVDGLAHLTIDDVSVVEDWYEVTEI